MFRESKGNTETKFPECSDMFTSLPGPIDQVEARSSLIIPINKKDGKWFLVRQKKSWVDSVRAVCDTRTSVSRIARFEQSQEQLRNPFHHESFQHCGSPCSYAKNRT